MPGKQQQQQNNKKKKLTAACNFPENFPKTAPRRRLWDVVSAGVEGGAGVEVGVGTVVTLAAC